MNTVVIDGNEAAADVAYRTNEICVIYPITPATQMGEFADEWSTQHKPNIWNTVPDVIEMQSEGGVAGAMHGILQTGALTTTFTSAQGLLLMIPNMYHISAELTPTVFHIASRMIASHGMTIYCEHSDVMAVRATGFAMLCSKNVQEAHDMALIAQAVSLKSRVPFVHFFEGLRTSHEMRKIERLTDEQIHAMIEDDLVIKHRERRMRAEKPFVRGCTYNSDILFQQRESVSSYYDRIPQIVEKYMHRLEKLTGRSYKSIEYYGHPQAERVIVLMSSGAETVQETIDYLQNEKIGMLQIRLFQPFPKNQFFDELPESCKAIAVLDCTKEPGAGGEPLYQKISTAILEANTEGILPTKILPKIIAGRFGIGSKEFTPGMVKTIFAELKKTTPKSNFTIGIDDDISHTSLAYDPNFNIESNDVIRAIFYGLGADGTLSANKNSIKIIGEQTDYSVQGYFIYDAKKTGSQTISHLRFGPKEIHSAYLIRSASFIGCHQFDFIKKQDVLSCASNGATLLLNSPYSAEEVWDKLPFPVQQTIIDKQLKFFVIDAYKIAQQCNLGKRINTIMQTCFFALAKVMPVDAAITQIKEALTKTYANKGEKVVQQNFSAIDRSLENLTQVQVPNTATSSHKLSPLITDQTPASIRNIATKMLAGLGDELPVSSLPPDGTHPSGTTKWEKRNISMYAPVWNPENCIQCGRCSIVCPHSIIRAKCYDNKYLIKAPESFKSAKLRKNIKEKQFTLQVYSEHCAGCGLCEETCPVNDKAIKLQAKQSSILTTEQDNIKFFESLPQLDNINTNIATVNNVQFLPPLFEFSAACAGCGETPYLKLVSQLFGERMLVANACGCSTVYGGNLPMVPWTCNDEGYGPAWSNSLFEDNAEFGLGFRLTADKYRQKALELLSVLSVHIDKKLINAIQNTKQKKQKTAKEIKEQRNNVAQLKEQLKNLADPRAQDLLSIADFLVKQSIWAIGGDGWAYDIGFGGLDHVIASGRDINLLVLDTEVYSNTGGQASKATPRGSVVKFAANGKDKAKKDLGLMAITYGSVYVANIALGANPTQAIKALVEAENYPGPSLVIAYCHCIAHGIDMRQGMRQQELAVKSGYWPLYRYNPEREKQGLNPMQLDSQKPSISFAEYAKNENRFQILVRNNPKHAKYLMQLAQEDVNKRWHKHEVLAKG